MNAKGDIDMSMSRPRVIKQKNFWETYQITKINPTKNDKTFFKSPRILKVVLSNKKRIWVSWTQYISFHIQFFPSWFVNGC